MVFWIGLRRGALLNCRWLGRKRYHLPFSRCRVICQIWTDMTITYSNTVLDMKREREKKRKGQKGGLELMSLFA